MEIRTSRKCEGGRAVPNDVFHQIGSGQEVRTSPAEQPLPELPECALRSWIIWNWGEAPKSPGPSTAAPARTSNLPTGSISIYHMQMHHLSTNYIHRLKCINLVYTIIPSLSTIIPIIPSFIHQCGIPVCIQNVHRFSQILQRNPSGLLIACCLRSSRVTVGFAISKCRNWGKTWQMEVQQQNVKCMYIICTKHVAGRKRIHLNAWNADFVPCKVSKQGTSICHLLLPDARATSGNNCS